MKRFILFGLITVPFMLSGQGTSLKPLPEYTHVTPQMTRKQVDSVITALSPYELYLQFDTLLYDENNRIKTVSGSLEGKSEYFPLSSGNFKGITIINRNDTTLVIMGLLYPPQKK